MQCQVFSPYLTSVLSNFYFYFITGWSGGPFHFNLWNALMLVMKYEVLEWIVKEWNPIHCSGRSIIRIPCWCSSTDAHKGWVSFTQISQQLLSFPCRLHCREGLVFFAEAGNAQGMWCCVIQIGSLSRQRTPFLPDFRPASVESNKNFHLKKRKWSHF